MIITINNEEGNTLYDVNKISDESAKQEATVIVQKVGNLQVIMKDNKVCRIQLVNEDNSIFAQSVLTNGTSYESQV